MCEREVLRKQPMAYGRLLFILTQALWSVYTKGGLAALHQLRVPKLGRCLALRDRERYTYLGNLDT